MPKGTIAIAVLGLGPAGRAMLPYIAAHPGYRLVAVCDTNPEATARVAEPGVTRHSRLESLALDARVEAVFVATPSWLHETHAITLLNAGKQVLVEKPMATSLGEADAMIAAAHRSGLVLLVGHSQSFEPGIQVMRAVIESGRIGALRAISGINYGDWMRRPRRPEELDRRHGGGVVFRQAAHHVDVVRYLATTAPSRLGAVVGDWDRDRPGDGSYSALLQFEDGVVATLTYSGYGHFSSGELTFGLNESGAVELPPVEIGGGPAPLADRRDELLRPGAYPATFGLLVASCEQADMRICREGVRIYHRDRQTLLPLTGLQSGRAAVLDEFAKALGGFDTTHRGCWGRDNLRVCIAMLHASDSFRQFDFDPAEFDSQVFLPGHVIDHVEQALQ